MKKKVLASLIAGGIIFGGQAAAATTPETVIYEQNWLDCHIDSVMKHAESHTDDGYVEIVTTLNGTVFRASSADHTIKQVTHYIEGKRVDGAVCGEEFDESKMTYRKICDWKHHGMHYYTYQSPDGTILRVATILGKVANLNEISKTLANC
jgi:hypothetical protein